jgi:hypothetical protein
MLKHARFIAFSIGIFLLGFAARGFLPETVAQAQSRGRVFELRTYTAPEGKLAELHARFATTRCGSSTSTG